MKVIQVVGYKRSGKTTLTKTIIQAITKKGFKVASLKHHGHGGTPLGIEETDSEQHRRAGALIAGVEGEGTLQLSSQSSWKMEQMLAVYECLNIDILVMEGFKTYHYDKIVLIRGKDDLHLLEQVTNIKAVITSFPLERTLYPYPIFNRNEEKGFKDWLFSVMNI